MDSYSFVLHRSQFTQHWYVVVSSLWNSGGIMAGRSSVWTSGFCDVPQFLHKCYLSIGHLAFSALSTSQIFPCGLSTWSLTFVAPCVCIAYRQVWGQCHLFLPYPTKYMCFLRICVNRNKLFQEVRTFVFNWGFSLHLVGKEIKGTVPAWLRSHRLVSRMCIYC